MTTITILTAARTPNTARSHTTAAGGELETISVVGGAVSVGEQYSHDFGHNCLPFRLTGIAL